MRKIWKIGMVGIGMLILLVSAVSAFGNQPSSELMNDGTSLTQKANELLANAELKEVQADHYQLVVDGEVVGVLWKNVNLSELTIGEPFVARWGAKAPLMSGEEVVGQIFIEGKPFGWMHSNAMERYGQSHSGNGCGCANHGDEQQHGLGNGHGHWGQGNGQHSMERSMNCDGEGYRWMQNR